MIGNITAEEIVGAYSQWLNKAGAHRTKSEMIIAQTSLVTGIPVSALIGRERTRPIAHARQDAMLRMTEETDLSLPQIGRLFRRDHTTVLHGVRAAKVRRELRRRAMGEFKSVRTKS